MRDFVNRDGRGWKVRLDDGLPDASGFPRRIGWEAVLFEAIPPGRAQKVAYRPAGWLSSAPVEELVNALHEAIAVRARWEAPLL